MKIVNLWLVTMYEYQNIWSKEDFLIKNVKNIVPWTYAISDISGDEIVETFYEK